MNRLNLPPAGSSRAGGSATCSPGRTGWGWGRTLIAAIATLAAPAPAQAPPAIPTVAATVVQRLPHDRAAFTEGLFFRDGAFWEATGEVGTSTIRKVDPATGKVLRQVTIPPPFFEEGIAPVGNEIVSLTWKQGIGWRWTIDGLKRVGSFRYTGEGWALASDGRMLVMSDGTSRLRVLDPATMKVVRTIAVTYRGQPLDQLNELEIVHGRILANVWRSSGIVRIDPATGAVLGVLDLSPLVREVAATNVEAVPNGIAWDAKRGRLFVTGKLWPTMFQVALPRGW